MNTFSAENAAAGYAVAVIYKKEPAMFNKSHPKKSAVEKWIDEHRELLLFVIVVPVGKLLSIFENIASRLTSPQPSLHCARVERVRSDVERYAASRSSIRKESRKTLRTDRKGTHSLNVRVSDKSHSVCVPMHDLRSVVSLDTDSMVIRVEPFVTIGEVVDYLDRRGFQLAAAIEMKGATIAGLILAVGMTTNSHIQGLMHEIVEAYEIVTADGRLIRATRDGEHADLFRAMPWSHGTLGLLVALELRVEKAPKYVCLHYRPMRDLDEFVTEHTRLLTSESPPDYLEAQVFGRNAAVIIEGYKTNERPSREIPKNDVAQWDKPFFFKHVESMLNLPDGETRSELVPNASFIMRHDRSMCMTMGKILPGANNSVYRRLFGWMLPPNMAFLKASRPHEERERTMKRQVYQDLGFPHERLRDMLVHLDKEFEIYPLLVYPCKVIDRGGMLRLPGQHGREWDGKERSAFYFNLGIYGEPKAVRNGALDYPTVRKVREVEGMVRTWGGFLHTYVDVFCTREEFEEMFDHRLWRKMREKYAAEGVFPTVYEKVKPELDPLQFLDDEFVPAAKG